MQFVGGEACSRLKPQSARVIILAVRKLPDTGIRRSIGLKSRNRLELAIKCRIDLSLNYRRCPVRPLADQPGTRRTLGKRLHQAIAAGRSRALLPQLRHDAVQGEVGRNNPLRRIDFHCFC